MAAEAAKRRAEFGEAGADAQRRRPSACGTSGVNRKSGMTKTRYQSAVKRAGGAVALVAARIEPEDRREPEDRLAGRGIADEEARG